MKAKTKALLATAAMTFAMSTQAYAQYIVNKTDSAFKNSPVNQVAQGELSRFLNIRYYLTVPEVRYAPLGKIADASPTKLQNPIIAIDYQHKDPAIGGKKSNTGLRLFAVNAGIGREKVSHILALSGLVNTGDALLSYRKEWNESMAYSHIQLGVSHAGMAYIDTDPKDKQPYLYNLDMPLNEETVGADKKSKLTAHHYVEAPLVHIVRAKNISQKQRQNLLEWSRRIAQQSKSAYPSAISFNQDYAAPKYKPGKPLDFVADTARVGLGISNGKSLDMYCSEFVWSVLSLKNCSPTDNARDFAQRGSVPSCISPIYNPMKVIGDSTEPGMAEGPTMIAAQTGLSEQEQAALIQSVFNPVGRATNISSGHRAVEDQLGQAFFQGLNGYYMTNDANIKNAMNGAQGPNYSPTSLLLNALLPDENPTKVFEYVGTLVYLDAASYAKMKAAVVK